MFVHKWTSSTDSEYRVWLQDFKNEAGDESALILDEYSKERKAFRISQGFRSLYLSGDGPKDWGMPYTNEIWSRYANSPDSSSGDPIQPGEYISVQKFHQVKEVSSSLIKTGRKTMVWKSGIASQHFPVAEFQINAQSCSGVCPQVGDQVYVVDNNAPGFPQNDKPWPYAGITIGNSGSTGKWFTKPGNYNFVLHNIDGSRKEGWGLSALITEGNHQQIGDYVDETGTPVEEEEEIVVEEAEERVLYEQS